MNGAFDLGGCQLRKFFNELGGNGFLACKCHERIAENDFTPSDLLDIILDILRIRGDDRAVIVVVGVSEFIAFIEQGRIKNEIHILMDQPHDMAVNELRRVTFGFTRDRFDAELVNLAVRVRGEYDSVSQFCKKRMPERIVFVHIQYTRNTDSAACGNARRKRFISEDAGKLVFVQIRYIVFVFLLSESALAAIA